MGYEGWASLAGTEIINNDRVRAYAAHLVPNLQMSLGSPEEADEALRKMLDDEPYRTPVLDDAPWVDPDDPDTYEFCGVLGLSAVGLSDSTRTATVAEHSGDGAGITGRRKGSRSIRYSALLVGATQAAVEAGHAWLSAALEGDCDGDCNGSDLCFLQAVVDPQDWGDIVTSGIKLSTLTADSGRYNTSTGRWTPSTSTQELRTPKFPLPLPCDEIVYEFTLRGVAGTQVALRSYAETGLVFEDVVTIDSDGEATRSVSDKNTGKTASWAALRLKVGSYVDVVKVTVSYRDEAKNSECFDHYMRQVRECSPVDGPTTVDDFALSCGAMRRVEFTLTSAKPWLFGTSHTIVPYTTTLLTKAKADQSLPFFKLSKTPKMPDGPKKPGLVVDPDCPKIPAPPRPAASFSSCGPTPSYDVSYGISIPGDLVPLWHEAVPWVSLFAGEKAAKAVRIRFYPRPLGTLQDVADLDEDTMCGAFIVDYIPAGGYVKLDGANQRAYAKQPGKNQGPGDHLLSGLSTAQLFQWPVLTCGTDYVMVVDVDGQNQSLVSMTVALTARY